MLIEKLSHNKRNVTIGILTNNKDFYRKINNVLNEECDEHSKSEWYDGNTYFNYNMGTNRVVLAFSEIVEFTFLPNKIDFNIIYFNEIEKGNHMDIVYGDGHDFHHKSNETLNLDFILRKHKIRKINDRHNNQQWKI